MTQTPQRKQLHQMLDLITASILDDFSSFSHPGIFKSAKGDFSLVHTSPTLQVAMRLHHN